MGLVSLTSEVCEMPLLHSGQLANEKEIAGAEGDEIYISKSARNVSLCACDGSWRYVCVFEHAREYAKLTQRNCGC